MNVILTSKDLKQYLWVCTVSILTSCGVNLPEDVQLAYDELPAEIDFNIHVKPIISDRCFTCHGPDEQTKKANLRLDNKEGLFAKGESGNMLLYLET